MRNKQWEAIHTLFARVEELTGKLKTGGLFRFLPDTVQQAISKKGARQDTESSGSESNKDIVMARSEIRTQLEMLRADLSDLLSERDCYLVLFPIVIHIDELIQSEYLHGTQSWPPLQKELFSIDDGGVQFYDTLDDLLRKPDTHPFIFEVFYFCMSHGFQGRYIENRVKINEYMKRLKNKIPVEEVKTQSSGPGEIVQIRFFGSPLWYYVGTAAILAAGYFLLTYLAAQQSFSDFL